MYYLDFEEPLKEIDDKLAQIAQKAGTDTDIIAQEQQRLLDKQTRLLQSIYKKLSPWQKTRLARHESRPHFCDYVAGMTDDFMPLAGDKLFAEDGAIIGGFATIGGKKVMLMGHEKGHDMASRLEHNFGMAKPEGYRKVVRLMQLADKFHLPIITLIDTAGAFPGIDAEERGQGRAIAQAIQTGLQVGVPIISCIIGEGGSGGALALGTGNSILMLENAIYSVISPEGCASILLKDAGQADKMAGRLHLTADDLLQLKLIDTVIPEPLGGAHRNPKQTIAAVKTALLAALNQWMPLSADDIRKKRRDKFLAMTRLEK